jgi:hypothetical protein
LIGLWDLFLAAGIGDTDQQLWSRILLFLFYWFDLCSYVVENLVEPGNSKKIMQPNVKASVIPPSQTINERGERTTG